MPKEIKIIPDRATRLIFSLFLVLSLALETGIFVFAMVFHGIDHQILWNDDISRFTQQI
jgi:hypothetical protein